MTRRELLHPKRKVKDLRVNGRPVKQSDTDGYALLVAQGFAVAETNIPPERSKAEDLFVVTCEYDPGEKRVLTEGW